MCRRPGLEFSLRCYSYLDRMQPQFAAFVGTITQGDLPTEGMASLYIEMAPGNEAFRMLQEGVASAEDIDKALKLGLNHPMGPFEMVDLVGLDVRLSILEFLHRSLGEAYRPNQILVQHVRAGRLGRKVGRGVYTYNENGERV